MFLDAVWELGLCGEKGRLREGKGSLPAMPLSCVCRMHCIRAPHAAPCPAFVSSWAQVSLPSVRRRCDRAIHCIPPYLPCSSRNTRCCPPSRSRSYDYLPYPPGIADGFRLDAEKWPGGGVDSYLQAVVQEILPYTEKAYGVSTDPALRVFGGSSFGGICALCCAVRHPGVFGGLLVESPSLWFGEERMLRNELPAYGGPWPQRMYLAMGTEVRHDEMTKYF